MISFGHGTTGLDEPCGPSVSNTLLGFSSIVVGYVSKGYAVALADYQGLGSPGVHPYTDAKTAGLNMIDAVRALRHTFDGVPARWAAVGGSQGGGAAWAADEQAASYAPELDLVGAVAYVPAADVTGLVDKAVAGTMSKDQSLGLPGHRGVTGAAAPRRRPRRLSARCGRHATGTCCRRAPDRRRRVGRRLPKPSDPETSPPPRPPRPIACASFLRAWALPQQRLTAPLSVTYAGRDEFIDAQWTTDAIARACALGGNVEWELQPDKGHGDVDVAVPIRLDRRQIRGQAGSQPVSAGWRRIGWLDMNSTTRAAASGAKS